MTSSKNGQKKKPNYNLPQKVYINIAHFAMNFASGFFVFGHKTVDYIQVMILRQKLKKPKFKRENHDQ